MSSFCEIELKLLNSAKQLKVADKKFYKSYYFEKSNICLKRTLDFYSFVCLFIYIFIIIYKLNTVTFRHFSSRRKCPNLSGALQYIVTVLDTYMLCCCKLLISYSRHLFFYDCFYLFSLRRHCHCKRILSIIGRPSHIIT